MTIVKKEAYMTGMSIYYRPTLKELIIQNLLYNWKGKSK